MRGAHCTGEVNFHAVITSAFVDVDRSSFEVDGSQTFCFLDAEGPQAFAFEATRSFKSPLFFTSFVFKSKFFLEEKWVVNTGQYACLQKCFKV